MPEPAPRFLIVDGHNIIHMWDELRRLHERGDKRYLAREELLKRMRTLQDMSGERVVVVFDGTGSKITDEHTPQDVQVFYADASHTADAVIERLAAKYASQFAIRVCTADRMIWEGARASGAEWISPDLLRHEVDHAERALQTRLKT
jgi:predicted RNA-binding protein with PIN domain